MEILIIVNVIKRLVGGRKLSLEDSEWTISFQSRFGKAEWLKPYTTSTIVKLVQERNIKKLHVICPGFISDCLETLEEINMEERRFS